MKKLIHYSLLLLAILVISACALDFLYTLVYTHGSTRNKTMWVQQMEAQQKLDYLILGSSRANQNLDPIQINTKTNLNGINLGVEGYGPFEMHLLLHEYLKHRTVDRVFVQVDELYLDTFPHKLSETYWLPYIRDPYIYSQFKPFGTKYTLYKYIPFYRYADRDGELGFRNVVASLGGKEQPYEQSLGFNPQTSVLQTEIPYIPSEPITQRNSHIDKLINLCRAKNIKIDFFTAPIYKFEGDLSPLKTYLPAYTSFKDSIETRSLFADQIHLNTEGARLFTEMFTETYFESPK